RALSEAGAAIIFAGEPEQWMRHPARADLAGIGNVQIVALDVTDETSLRKALGAIGGRVDIVIDNSQFERPGDLMSRPDAVFARQEAEVLWLGLLRLAQVFGPALRARGLDRPVSAAAWVSLIATSAIAPEAGWAAQSAAQAARLSATQSLRAEMRPGGVRVCAAFHGPLEHEWRQGEPPPQLVPAQIARGVMEMLRAGTEETWIGDVARDIHARWRADPSLYEREALEAFRR
ncbi:MAG: SDR family oxidoreductase, partial [Rhodobacteraceae bacterium]|nr:SDR family oxidoreductase [Paracoccaceae bacterium]